jgi:hypothetical protein
MLFTFFAYQPARMVCGGLVAMNIWAGTGFVALAGGLIYYFVDQKPADVYDMPVGQAYSLLYNVKYEPLTEGQVAAEIERSTSGNGTDTVTWETRGSHTRRSCDLKLVPFEGDAERTHVTVTCAGGGAGEGAAAGIVHNMHRNGVIERVDATLTGRPFNSQQIGETSSRWPSDGVDGSLGGAINEAVEMDRDMRKMQREFTEMEREAIEQAELDAFNSGY